MKRILLAFLAFTVHVGLHAQPLHGRVLDDSTGTGLQQASVMVTGTTRGTTSGPDGLFTLAIPKDGKKHSITVSLTGYLTATVPLTDTTSGLLVRLKRNPAALEDVVVIGYQTVRRRDVLASVSSVSSKDLKDIPLNSAEEALAGRLAGVQVTGAEGSPNAQILIRVRGGGSITQSNSPLYVVDGIQLDSALQFISPQDIASIDVLKDAASTSIYGARGSNGVVLITTKGGRNTGGKTTISYNGFLGDSKITKELPVQRPYDFMYYQYERAQLTGDTTGIAPYGNSWDSVEKYKQVPFYDWQKKLFGRNAFQMTHNINVSGGTDQTQYYLSATDATQNGIMLLSDFERKLLYFRFDHQAAQNLKIGANIRFNNTVTDGAGTSNPGASSLNFLRNVIRYRPFLAAGQSANSFDYSYYSSTDNNSLNLVNPVLLNQSQYRKSTNNIIDLSGFAEYKFTRYLSFRSTLGYDNNSLRANAFDDTLTSNAQINGGGLPLANIETTTVTTVDNSNVFSYSNAGLSGRFKQHNDLTVIAGEETYQTQQYDNYVQTNFYPVGTTAEAALANMNLGTPPSSGQAEPKPTSDVIPTRLLSFFSRATYGYDQKYLFSASVRADASSLFAESNRWGYFPAGNAAWRISNEKFMQHVTWIDDLKLRLAYGEAGNNRIAPFQYLTEYNTNSQYGLAQNLTTGYAPAALTNPDLKWESTISRNIGIDLNAFNNRLGFTVDVYDNTTNNLLVAVPVPTTTGYTSQLQNVGSTRNKGIEFQVSGIIMQKRAFSWTGNFNLSFNKNTVVSLGNQEQSYLQNSGWAGSSNLPDYIVKVGQPVGAMYGYLSDGYYQTSDFTYHAATRTYTLNPGVVDNANVTATQAMPGGMKYKGLNGDTAISAADRTIIGSAQPKFFGGFSQQFTYKGFDCSIFVNFQYGNKIYNDNKLEFSSGYTPGATLLGIMKNRWHTVDQNGNVYESVQNGAISGASPDSLNALNKGAKLWIPLVGSSSTTFSSNSWSVEDGSFLRINNITLGYTLPPNLVRKMHVSRLRIYGTVNNVAIITHYTGYDPEVNTRSSTPVTPGVDYSAYPRSRTYVGGINLTF
jgi:TonB-linked SusC/RagA family outer membrane protein